MNNYSTKWNKIEENDELKTVEVYLVTIFIKDETKRLSDAEVHTVNDDFDEDRVL